jgi:hypothetical protein
MSLGTNYSRGTTAKQNLIMMIKFDLVENHTIDEVEEMTKNFNKKSIEELENFRGGLK